MKIIKSIITATAITLGMTLFVLALSMGFGMCIESASASEDWQENLDRTIERLEAEEQNEKAAVGRSYADDHQPLLDYHVKAVKSQVAVLGVEQYVEMFVVLDSQLQGCSALSMISKNRDDLTLITKHRMGMLIAIGTTIDGMTYEDAEAAMSAHVTNEKLLIDTFEAVSNFPAETAQKLTALCDSHKKQFIAIDEQVR